MTPIRPWTRPGPPARHGFGTSRCAILRRDLHGTVPPLARVRENVTCWAGDAARAIHGGRGSPTRRADRHRLGVGAVRRRAVPHGSPRRARARPPRPVDERDRRRPGPHREDRARAPERVSRLLHAARADGGRGEARARARVGLSPSRAPAAPVHPPTVAPRAPSPPRTAAT